MIISYSKKNLKDFQNFFFQGNNIILINFDAYLMDYGTIIMSKYQKIAIHTFRSVFTVKVAKQLSERPAETLNISVKRACRVRNK